MKNNATANHPTIPLTIILADDDSDDHHFFSKVLKTVPFNTKLTILEDGEKLMTYLLDNMFNLPDVLFLDHNMPRKNGAECLLEIKAHPVLNKLPVVMYSTYLHEDVADVLYNNGAHFYVRKTNLTELKKTLIQVLTLIVEKKFIRPVRTKFILSFLTVIPLISFNV